MFNKKGGLIQSSLTFKEIKMNLISFNYNSNIVRTQVTDDGEPLFCLADVCKVLELNGTKNTVRQLKEEFGCPVLNTGHLVGSLGRNQ